MDIVTSFIVPALVGIVVGILSGLLGIGGGTILVPVFRLAFGMSPVMSTATSLFTIIPVSYTHLDVYKRQSLNKKVWTRKPTWIPRILGLWPTIRYSATMAAPIRSWTCS